MLDINSTPEQKKVFFSNMMSEVASNSLLDGACAHVYERRKEDSHNSDIWSLMLSWPEQKEEIRNQLLRGDYRLSPLTRFKGSDGDEYTRWDSRDAIVLKALSLVQSGVVKHELADKCYHIKGCGGLKGAIRDIHAKLVPSRCDNKEVKELDRHEGYPDERYKKDKEYTEYNKLKEYNYVIKSDISNFYGSIDHEILLDHCKQIVKDKRIIEILRQYMDRLEVEDGIYYQVKQGIPKGCPIAPLMGALILKSLDNIAGPECVYVRYMDDWVILARTKWQVHRLVKKMQQVLHELKLKLSKEKTYIGRIGRGFVFLGYCFSKEGIIGLADKTIGNFLEKAARLYEQGATDQRISSYINRWCGWALVGWLSTSSPAAEAFRVGPTPSP